MQHSQRLAPLILTALVVLLTGCTQATLTPTNREAEAIGVAHLHYAPGVPGGPIFVTLADGRKLAGSLYIDESGTTPVSMEGGTPEYFGLSGGNLRVTVHDIYTTMACRALLIGGHGTGTCRDQNGGIYRLDV